MRAPTALFLLLLAFSVGACGDQQGGGAGVGDGVCLTAEQVREEVDRIASGIESSPADVEEKQQQIQEVNAQAC